MSDQVNQAQVVPLMKKLSSKKSIKVNEDTGIVCGVCLGFIKPEENAKLACGHDYHPFCLSEYLKS